MDFPIKGGTAVITGAASGIGAALALNLAKRGMHLALADRNEAGLAANAAAARAEGVTVSEHLLDVTDADALAALPDAVLQAHGRVTLLVNNAGVALIGNFDQVSPQDFAWVMEVNFWAPVRLTRAFLYALHREPAAHIVNLSSIFGIIGPPGNAAYCASKFAVRGFSEALRHELASSTVTLTVVHPGGIRTAIVDTARLSQGIDPDEARVAKAEFNKVLKTSAEDAAEQIAQAIQKRRGRLLIGGDARMLDRIQRIFPMTYWKHISRLQGNFASKIAPNRDRTMASWQAHVLDALLRLTVKRRLRGNQDLGAVRAVLNGGTLPYPKDIIYRADWLGGVAGEWVTAPSASGTAPVLLYLHGGGYFACSALTHRPLTSWFARAGFRVFAPNYRLAPENRFPAAVEDAEAAYLGLLDAGFAAENIAVAGDSAGGGLAMALLLRLRDRTHRLPSGAALFSPWTDLAITGDSMRGNVKSDAMFWAPGLPAGAAFYLGEADPRTPLASPLYGDLHGLPPLLIHVGARELLRDDSTRLAEKAQLAGVKVTSRVWPVVPHVWQLVHRFVPEGRESLGEATAFLLDTVRQAGVRAPRPVAQPAL